MSFDQLGLSPELLRAVADQGYTEPTPVQSAAIPLVLAGRDVLAGAVGPDALLHLERQLARGDDDEDADGRAPLGHPRPRRRPHARAGAPGGGERPDLRRPRARLARRGRAGSQLTGRAWARCS